MMNMKTCEGRDRLMVECGSHNVVHIDKLFGPVVVQELRLWLDDEWHWVVEQQRFRSEDDIEPEWVQVARFHADPGSAAPGTFSNRVDAAPLLARVEASERRIVILEILVAQMAERLADPGALGCYGGAIYMNADLRGTLERVAKELKR